MRLGEEFDAAELEVAAPGWHRESSRGEVSSPLLELSEDDLSRLAANEGWDPAEVDAIRSFLGRSATDAPPSPEGGLAASPPPDVLPPSRDVSETVTETASPDASAAAGEPQQADRDAEWLKARRGPAATAYRRLRRLFQG